jgi:hypothetical protein
LDTLKAELNKKAQYDREKEAGILKLKRTLAHTPDVNKQFNLSVKLYDEYKSYQFDSAYVFALKLQDQSRQLKDRSKEYFSRIKMAFILLSSGMFKETFENLKGIDVSALDEPVMITINITHPAITN